jgi:hypothetical protein
LVNAYSSDFLCRTTDLQVVPGRPNPAEPEADVCEHDDVDESPASDGDDVMESPHSPENSRIHAAAEYMV